MRHMLRARQNFFIETIYDLLVFIEAICEIGRANYGWREMHRSALARLSITRGIEGGTEALKGQRLQMPSAL